MPTEGDHKAGVLTLRKLADRLDISVATASRALAGHERIALSTRERVNAAAREMGYVPNRAARQLVSGRSHFAGLILPIRGPDFVDSFLGDFVTGLGEGLVQHGFDLILVTAPEGQSELSVLQTVVESGRADGIIVPRVAEADRRIAYLKKRRFPFIAHGRLREGNDDFHWLDSDGEKAFAEAFDLLYELGHRRFGLLTIDDPMTFKLLRQRGLTEAIERRGDPAVTLKIESAPRFDEPARAAAVARMLDGVDRPTAVIGLFDQLALAVLSEAARRGLSVPDDLSVVGFDNISPSAYAPPGLTTFDTDIRGCARSIAGMLAAITKDPSGPPLSRLIEPKLVKRGSHGPAPTGSF